MSAPAREQQRLSNLAVVVCAIDTAIVFLTALLVVDIVMAVFL